MGKESNCLAQKYKAMGKESNFLFPPPPLNAQLFLPTNPSPHGEGVKQGVSRSLAMQNYPLQILLHMGNSQAFFCKMQSYPSQQILPILCREGFFPIMQNFYKSFPTNLYPFFFIFHFIFIYLFFLLCFIIFFLLFKVSFQFSFLFCKTWNSSPKGQNYSPAFGANNRRIDAPASCSRLSWALDWVNMSCILTAHKYTKPNA